MSNWKKSTGKYWWCGGAVLTPQQGNFSLQQSTTGNYNPSKCRAVPRSPNWYIYSTLWNLRLGEHCRRGAGRLWESEDQEVCCETVSPSNIKSNTQKGSPTWRLTGQLTNEHAKLDREKKPTKPQTHTENYKQPWQQERWPPQGSASQFAVQCQTASPENIHAGSIIWAKQTVFRNIHTRTYAYMNAITMRLFLRYEFEEEQGESYVRVWWWEREGKRNVSYNFKIWNTCISTYILYICTNTYMCIYTDDALCMRMGMKMKITACNFLAQ